MAPDSGTPGLLPFRQLRLRPKALVQVSRRGDGAAAQDWQFAAGIDGRGLMLAPMPGQAMPKLGSGTYHVQGFTGQYDFHLDADLLGLFEVPFAYALFAWPTFVRARLVRQALRVRTLLPAELLDAEGRQQVATILDLSASGALVEVAQPIGGVGASARLSFIVEADGEKAQISTPAIVCHQRDLEGPRRERLGLGFRALPRTERALLSLYLHDLEGQQGLD